MARSVPEWIGKNDDAVPPATVRLRVWERHQGRCHICGGPITQKKWECDHVIPLKDKPGGNRETNLAPAHAICHRAKTAKENAERAKITRQRQKQASIRKQPKQKIPARPFPKVDNESAPSKKRSLPPRSMFRSK
jgi:5-methylcytosine-specific restriction enzyme A